MPQFTEACDGENFGTDSCTVRGYGSGALTCESSCTVNATSCSDCGAGSHIASCGPMPLDIAPFLAKVAIAATDTEIGVAWIASGISFARFSADTTLLTQTHIADTVFDSSSAYGVLGVGTLPAGWVVAAAAQPELFIHALDATGKDLGRTRVEGSPIYFEPSLPTFASRPGGGPLLVWDGATKLRATIVAADGRSVSTPVDLPARRGQPVNLRRLGRRRVLRRSCDPGEPNPDRPRRRRRL